MNKTRFIRLASLIAVGITLFAMPAVTHGQQFNNNGLFNQPPVGETTPTATGEATRFDNSVPATATSPATAVATPTGTPGATTTQKPTESSTLNEDSTTTADSKSTNTASSSGKKNFAQSLIDVVTGAGPMMFAILGCSMVLVMFVLERTIALRRRRVIPKHFVKLFLEELEEGQLKPVEALELCEENNSPIAQVFAGAVKKWNRPCVEVEQAVIDAGERVANGLRRYLRLFNGIATISPLLGLLGTVLGMIEAFNAIASSDAMGRPELLAEGISQALLTTAGGLSVAIPAFIAYMYFTSRVDRLIIEIDTLGQEVVGAIASDAWKPKAGRKTTKQAAKAA